jgi:hypothetical protein
MPAKKITDIESATGDPAMKKPNANALPSEPHHTTGEIAERYHLSDSKVRELFRDEPDVIKLGGVSRLLGGQTKRYTRRYEPLRIPESVVRRVMGRLMNKRPPGSSDDPNGNGNGNAS